jgi:hypothetical protein
MAEFTIPFAILLAGVTLGWTAFFSFVVSPQAFRELDHGRANRFVREAMKTGNPAVAGFAFASALLAVLGMAIAGGGVMAIAGVLYLLAAWTLAPRDDKLPPPGGRRWVDGRDHGSGGAGRGFDRAARVRGKAADT